MKKYILLIIFVLLVVTTANAGTKSVTHKVKSGENPTSIGIIYGVTANELMKFNRIENARNLKVGRELNIPLPTEKSVAKKTAKKAAKKTIAPRKQKTITGFGSAPYDVGGANFKKQIKMLKNMAIPTEYKKRFIERYNAAWNSKENRWREGAFAWEELTGEQHPEQMASKGGRIMDHPPINLTGIEPARVMSETIGDLTISVKTPIGCGNTSWYVYKVEPPKPSMTKVVFKETPAPVEPAPEPEKIVIDYVPPMPGNAKYWKELEKQWESQIGFGHYETVGTDADGEFLWFNLRYWLSDFYDTFGASRILIGPSIGFSVWEGHDREYEYEGFKWLIGPAIKVDGADWTIDAESRFGRVYSDGRIVDYRSSQVDTMWENFVNFSYYERRNLGKRLFPEWSLTAMFSKSLSATNERTVNGHEIGPDVYNNEAASVRFTLSLYDIDLGNKYELTPKIGLGYGYEGGRDTYYGQGIPQAELRYDGWSVGGINIYDYKAFKSYNDVYVPVEIWFDLQGVKKVWTDKTTKQSQHL